jgi:nitroreductase
MSPIQLAESVIQDLQWRYATKKFDGNKKIPSEVWTNIEQALTLSPSSFGLQPYKFVIVTDQKIKDALVAHSWNQSQPAHCSHVVVFARHEKLTPEYVDHYLDRVAEVRQVPKESLTEYGNMILGFLKNTPQPQMEEWMAKQCYIALGNLMTVASMLRVDNCPMEGFAQPEYDKILGLTKLGLRSVVVCALGYRHEEDRHGALSKVRLPANELFLHI